MFFVFFRKVAVFSCVFGIFANVFRLLSDVF